MPSMLVGQMPVNLAYQYTAILVSYPSGDRHVVDSRHDSIADEVVSGIMKREPLQFLWEQV